MPKIRVVLADDHQAVVAKVRSVLGEEFEVVDEVADGSQAIDAVSRRSRCTCDRYIHAGLRRAPSRRKATKG